MFTLTCLWKKSFGIPTPSPFPSFLFEMEWNSNTKTFKILKFRFFLKRYRSIFSVIVEDKTTSSEIRPTYRVSTHLFLVHNPQWTCTKNRWLCNSYRRPTYQASTHLFLVHNQNGCVLKIDRWLCNSYRRPNLSTQPKWMRTKNR